MKVLGLEKNKHCLFRVKPGVYLSASQTNPKRVPIKTLTPIIVLEERDDAGLVVAMIDSQTLILVHRDSLEKV